MNHINQSLALVNLYHIKHPDKRVYLTYSGGKDSTALLGLYLKALEQGLVTTEQFAVVHSNTTMEMPFMDSLVLRVKSMVEGFGLVFHLLTPPVEQRFYYNVIGRGVSIPNRSFRWCTDKLKIRPINKLLKGLPNAITATGERMGESRSRDLKLSGCGSDECGLKEQSKVFSDVLRPILNWSTCQVWDYLFELDNSGTLPKVFEYLSEIYSINEKTNGSLRTGCIGCPLIAKDKSLNSFVVKNTGYTPLVEIGAIWKRLTLPENRLTRKGRGGKEHMGAIKVEARQQAWVELLAIEARVQSTYPDFYLLDAEERKATQEALAAGTYPKGY